MGAGGARLDSADVQGRGFEVELIPPQVDQFGGPQAMPIGDKDHNGVPVAVAVALRRRDQPLDLMLGEVFARPQVAVSAPPRRNCSFYGGWRDQLEA
jgi:hypothetical protein